MSYCPPQVDILLRRRGYFSEHVAPIAADPMAALRRDADRLLAVLKELSYPTQNMLEAANMGISQKRTREVVRFCIDTGQAEYRDSPKRGGAQKYIHVVARGSAASTDAPTDSGDGASGHESPPRCGVAYRDDGGDAPTRPPHPSGPKVRQRRGDAPTTHLTQLDEKCWEGEL